MKILGVTACPSGVAHTYMAADAIKRACEKAGIECKVETQGSIGVEDEITVDDLKDATAVILTTNMPIKNADRFAEIPKVKMDAGTIIRAADSIVGKIKDQLG